MTAIRSLDIEFDNTKPMVYANCTQVVKYAHPYGGYISPKLFYKIELVDELDRDKLVNNMSEENLHPAVAGVSGRGVCIDKITQCDAVVQFRV